jgi:hypothetical protein
MGVPEPIRDGLGATILGPRNVALERENPELLASPSTDAGTLPNLKFPFAAARNRLLSGGWAREITRRELPVALIPPELVAAHLDFDAETLATVSQARAKPIIVR